MDSLQQVDRNEQKSKNNLVSLVQMILVSRRFQKYFKLIFLMIFCVIELVDLSFQILKIQQLSELQNDAILFFILIIISIIIIPLISYNIINAFLEEMLFCCLLGCLFESFLINEQRIFRLCAFFVFSQRTMNEVQSLKGNKVALFILVLYPALRYSIKNVLKIQQIFQNLLLLLINSLFSVIKYSKNNNVQEKSSTVIQQNSQKNYNFSLNNQTNLNNFIQNVQDIYEIQSDSSYKNQTLQEQSNISQIYNNSNTNHISIFHDEDHPHFNYFHAEQIKQKQEIHHINNLLPKRLSSIDNFNILKSEDLQIKLEYDLQKQQKNYIMDCILNKISTGIILLDKNKKLVYSNKPLKRIINKSKIFENITELTYFISLRLQTIYTPQKQFHETIEKNITQSRNQSPIKNFNEQKFSTSTKFDQFFKDQKQKRENENNNHYQGQFKQDQYGSVYYNQYQTSKNIQQLDKLKFLSPNQQQYRKTTTVEVFSNDPQNDNSLLTNNYSNNNNNSYNPLQNINQKKVQSSMIMLPVDIQINQPKNKGFKSIQDISSIQNLINQKIPKNPQQLSKVVQCILPDNINKLFTKQNLQIADVIDYLIKYSFSPQYKKMNTDVLPISEQNQEKYSNFYYKQQRYLENIEKTQKTKISSNDHKQNIEDSISGKKLKKMKKEGKKNLYDYFISNNYLHVTVQQEENDISQEEIAILEIKFGVLQQIGFENQKLILIEISDITKLKKQINNENLDIYKNKILSSVSHELRTPLNCSIQMLDMLYQNDEIPNMMKQIFVQPALNSNLLLLNIINDILDLAQINYGKFTMVFSKFELNQLCTECINLISMQALQKDIEIELDFDPDVPQIINSDSIRIRQVLLNLLSNALKFTQAGKIVIKTKLIEENLIQIDIKDSGCGISEKNLSTLQRRFSQKDIFNFEQNQQNNTQNSLGIGLGLTITNNLATGLGGNRKLFVQSVENVGTKFSFWIVNHPTHKIGCKFTKKNIFNQEIVVWQSISDYTQLQQQQNIKVQNDNLRQNTNSIKTNTLSGKQLLNQSVKSRQKNDELSSYVQNNNYLQSVQSLIKFNNDIQQNQGTYHQSINYQNNHLINHFDKELQTNSTHNLSLYEGKKITKFQLSFKEQSLLSEDQGSFYQVNLFQQNHGGEKTKAIDQINSNAENQENNQMTSHILRNENNPFENLNMQEKKSIQNNSGQQNHNSTAFPNIFQSKTISEFSHNMMQTQSVFSNQSNQHENKQIKFNKNPPILTHMNISSQYTADTLNPSIQNQLKSQICPLKQKSRQSLIDEESEEQFNINNQDESQNIQIPNQLFCYKASEKKINSTKSLNSQSIINIQNIDSSIKDKKAKVHFQDKHMNQNQQKEILSNQQHNDANYSDSITWIHDESIQSKINSKQLEEFQQNDKIYSSHIRMVESKSNQIPQNLSDPIEIQKYIKQSKTPISLIDLNYSQQQNQLFTSLNSQTIKSNSYILDNMNQSQVNFQDIKICRQSHIPIQHNSQSNIKQKIQNYLSSKKCQCPDILIVDDNDFNLYALETRLKTYGFNIDKATSGFFAIEKVQRKIEDEQNCCKHYSLIFMDIEMPNKTGIETTIDILSYYREKKIAQPPKISACTAYIQQTEQEKAKSCGMNYYITKPINQVKLEEVLISVFIDNKTQK